ncbi:T9SS type A sorting domain-containing protein [Aequorivita sp. H23M31]|uniref:T9SS type A sorting domain-containing protein n=1 Tax=Aequorivita ciconiae TaxID=2494375 RepID=A0A410G683_9FLAO|nr:T9SS type A sorting domain-containing protein [Aequorivita sp. H23M31]QAA82804.1 T9SS type A sorting domain-containing protein [Aequorivita sp. H23M31]
MKTITSILILLSIFTATAQWTTDTDQNTLVAESGELDVLARGTSDGQTYVVYWKNVPAPTFIELRLQVMDADGNRKFGDDGMLVSDQIPMGSYTVTMSATVDSDDHLYIGATGTGGGNPAFVFKMDVDGNHLWGTNGVQVGSGNVVTVLPLTNNQAIVSWMGSSGGVMQKFDETGAPIWAAEKPIEGASATVPGNLFELSDGNYIVVFHSLLFGINSNLYAQRYDSDGDPVWGAPVQLSNSATAFNQSYSGLQDGNIVYMGYFASQGTRFDSYLQRINPDGTLPWGINGADFDTNQTNYEMETEIAFEEGSGNIWAIATYRDQSQNERGEYVQKFNKDSGEGLLSENAKVVYPIGSEKSHAGELRLRNGNPLFLIEEGNNNGAMPTVLNAVYLDENGDFGWDTQTIPMATFAASKHRITFTREGNMQNVAIFAEDKGEGLKIYAQNLVDDTVGIDDYNTYSLFFANPVNDEMLIDSDSAINRVSIYNALGQEVFGSKYNAEKSVSIDTQSWTAGIYFMSISTENGIQKGIKLIKQ